MDRGMWVRVLDYVDSHIHEKISLCDLAEIAGYSPFYSRGQRAKRARWRAHLATVARVMIPRCLRRGIMTSAGCLQKRWGCL